MVVGVLTISLRLPGNDSLKAKRRVVKSILARLQREFNISAAEVGEQDSWQSAILGVACVSTSTGYAHGLLTRVVGWIESHRPDVPVVDFDIELL